MLSSLRTAALSLLSLVLVFHGLAAMVAGLFVPLAFIDIEPPAWLKVWTLELLGVALVALGVWIWIRAWRPHLKTVEDQK